MTLTSDVAQAPGLDFGSAVGTEPLARARLTKTTAQRAVAAAIVPMVMVTLGLAFTSDRLARPVAAGVYWAYLIAAPMVIGLYWWMRRPASRFGPLLVSFGILTWVVSWQGANAPVAFDLGVLAEAPFWLLTIYLFLAFPMGRLEPPAARWLMAALGLGALATFLPWALLSPVIAGGGPLTTCAPTCPPNALEIGSSPGLGADAGEAETYIALTLTVAVFVVYLKRLLSASRPQRRALMAVAVTSLLFLPAYFATNFAAWILKLPPNTISALAWCIVGTRILLPLGFVIALLQADRFATTVLRTLLERLTARPTPGQWRDMIAEALDDRSLRLGYHDPATTGFHESDGGELVPPPDAERRTWLPVRNDGRPVAAMVIDETLAEDPELVRAAASATVLAVQNGALEGQLRASRAEALAAGDAARRRIEHDLHDSAQQRLLALRIHLALASETIDGTEQRMMLERIDTEVGEALDDVRNVVRGEYPAVLRERGMAAALLAVSPHAGIPMRIEGRWRHRHGEEIERAVYLCCLEALQNAAKHAGPGSAATVRLTEENGFAGFSIKDDGVGFEPATVKRGAGLGSMSHRVSAVGGTLRIDSSKGHGTTVSGRVPV